MLEYRKKPIVIKAIRWYKNGDCVDIIPSDGEGRIVRYYRDPQDSGKRKCSLCKKIMHLHGWIDTLEGGHIVCPGDWIIMGIRGEYYPCKDDIFRKTYEPNNEDSEYYVGWAEKEW
jgi:hypothetical protein